MAEPVMQSSLGIIAKNSNKQERVNNLGTLAFGKVIKLHPKRYTADVQMYNSNDLLTSSSSIEGKYACRIGVGNAGYDKVLKKPYGEIIPIQVGSIVLVGFLKNTKEKPVILRVFHDITEDVGVNNSNNILPAQVLVTDETDLYRYLNITRIQDFFTMSGDGNIEAASHTKSFLVGINNKEVDEENFDFENLSVKDVNKLTVNSGEGNSKPMKWIAVFRDNFVDNLSNWLRIIVDASKMSFKLAKQQRSENKLSLFEIDQEGSIRLRRQQDTVAFEGSEKFTEVEVSANGSVSIKKVGDKVTTILVTDAGVSVTTDGTVDMSAESDINLKGKHINLYSGSSKVTMEPQSINMQNGTSNVNVSPNSVHMTGNVLANTQVVGTQGINDEEMMDIISDMNMDVTGLSKIQQKFLVVAQAIASSSSPITTAATYGIEATGGYCQRFVMGFYKAVLGTYTSYGSAKGAFGTIVSSDTSNIPVGAAVFGNSTYSPEYGHVVLYMGSGNVIHVINSSTSGTLIKVQSLQSLMSEKWFSYVGWGTYNMNITS